MSIIFSEIRVLKIKEQYDISNYHASKIYDCHVLSKYILNSINLRAHV